LLLVCLGVGLSACGGGGPYGYARTYQPLKDEKTHYNNAQTATYEEVKRDPNGYQDAEVAWFGVVRSVGELPDGRARVSLSLRAHQERHLCADERASSCRVTVSERDLGPFSAELVLRPEERHGQDRLWVGSLVKVYGHPTGEYDEDGGPVLRATYHRHFPRGTYVTTAQRAGMRR
jgi:hypothetical protein